MLFPSFRSSKSSVCVWLDSVCGILQWEGFSRAGRGNTQGCHFCLLALTRKGPGTCTRQPGHKESCFASSTNLEITEKDGLSFCINSFVIQNIFMYLFTSPWLIEWLNDWLIDFTRQQSIQDYGTLPDALVERALRVCKDNEHIVADVHSICIIMFENKKNFARRPAQHWTTNKISQYASKSSISF